ncbi:MAG: hypothetical protein V3S55_03760 [Nitrospiraceae bacterium]
MSERASQLVLDEEHLSHQQGRFFTATHRREGLAVGSTEQYLFDVSSIFHPHFHLSVGGNCHVDMSTVTSYTVGGGTSLDVWCRNTIFHDVNSFSTLLFRGTSIQAGSADLWSDFVPVAGQQDIGGHDPLVFGPGIFQLELTNTFISPIDTSLIVTFEESDHRIKIEQYTANF